MSYRLGVDVGGTFTDLLLINEQNGDIFTAKVPSTPHDSSVGVLNGITKGQQPVRFHGHDKPARENQFLRKTGGRIPESRRDEEHRKRNRPEVFIE